MPISKVRFTVPALLVALAAALPLAGCETSGDPVASILTSPGQYDLFECPAIKATAQGIVNRRYELEGLMARANRGPAGGLISAMTYQSEYVGLRGKMNELRRVAAANNCNFDPAALRPGQLQTQSPAKPLPPPSKKPPRRAERR